MPLVIYGLRGIHTCIYISAWKWFQETRCAQRKEAKIESCTFQLCIQIPSSLGIYILISWHLKNIMVIFRAVLQSWNMFCLIKNSYIGCMVIANEHNAGHDRVEHMLRSGETWVGRCKDKINTYNDGSLIIAIALNQM